MTEFAPKNLAQMNLLPLASACADRLEQRIPSLPSTPFPVAPGNGRVQHDFPSQPRESNSAPLLKRSPFYIAPSTRSRPSKRPLSPIPDAAVPEPVKKKKKPKTPRREIPLDSKPFLAPDLVENHAHFSAKHNIPSLSAFSPVNRPLRPNSRPKFERVQVGNFDIAVMSMPHRRRIGLQGKTIIAKFRHPEGSGGFECAYDKKPFPGAKIRPDGIDDTEWNRRQAVEARLVKADSRLKGFTFSHISRQASVERTATLYVDGKGRAFAVRVPMSENARKDGMAVELDEEMTKSVSVSSKAFIRPSTKEYGRGAYKCRLASLNNEQGNSPGYCPAFRKQAYAWMRLFNATSFATFRQSASSKPSQFFASFCADGRFLFADALEQFFPLLFDEHRRLAASFSNYSLNPLFGAFASVCINKGKVATIPHRDVSNRGPGLCGVVPFGTFDSSRSGLLILWEARTVIEVSAGDVCLFPSAILTHSNTAIHKSDDRNSLAFWTGASLFLLDDMKGRSKTDMSAEEEQGYYSRAPKNWKAAWEKFPIV